MQGTISIPRQGTPAVEVFRAAPEGSGKYSGLILIEEIWGVTAHIKDVASRLATEGYLVIAPELLAETGVLEKISPSIYADMHDPEKRHEAQARMREATAPVWTPEFAAGAMEKLRACVEYLIADEACDGSIGVVGFCFGGTYAFHLAAADSRIKAIVPFYGQLPSDEEVEKISCPVLNFNGEKDERIMAQMPVLEAAMKKYGKAYESIIYPDAGHAFFNDTNTIAYNADAAKDAWQRTLVFLRAHLS